MTPDELQATVSKLADETDLELVSIYINQAKDEVLSYRYPFGYAHILEDVIKAFYLRHEQSIIKIAVYLLNKRGAEGETAHNEGGVSRSYGTADIPDAYFKGIVPVASVIGGAVIETIEPEP